MKIRIADKVHNVLSIEYNGSIPHSVTTEYYVATANEPYWRRVFWDFFANNGENRDICAYASGSGGYTGGIDAPHWADGDAGEIWLADTVKLVGKIINGTQLKKPKRIRGWFKSSINPFKVADIVSSYSYCERCGYDSTDFCFKHKYDDSDGTARYIDDNSMAE